MSSLTDIADVATHVIKTATSLGAQEVMVAASSSVYTELSQRDGQIETCQESRSRSVSVEVLVDDRYSAHSTNDLRPEAMSEFLKRAIEATRFLEPDPDRRLVESDQMGSVSAASLDAIDPQWPPSSSSFRRNQVANLESACLSAASHADVRSVTTAHWDGWVDSCLMSSNGFSGRWEQTSVGHGAQIALEDKDNRLPEASAYYGARHRADLPSIEMCANTLIERGLQRLGSHPAPSGQYPMLLENRSVGRLLRVLIGPLSGSAIYEGRSCLKGRLGDQLTDSAFSIIDDPLIPRASASRPFTGDGTPPTRRHILKDGVLENFYINVYNSRRLNTPATSGGTSNLVIPPGPRSTGQILAGLPKAMVIRGFIGGNTNATTGDFSFGVHGTLFEHGNPTQAISEMNISGNLFDLLERWAETASDVWTHGAWRSPSLLFDGIQFSGTQC